MDFLLEIGCEEIPARFIEPALRSIQDGFARRIEEARLGSRNDVTLRTMGTPRRLALLARGLPERQADLDEQSIGPRVEAAFDADGKPTRACLGFARSKGVDPGQLTVFETPKGRAVGLERRVIGKHTAEILPGLLGDLLAELSFPKSMRWGDGNHRFVRPLHWIVALLDNQVVPFSFMGADSGRVSRGHRFASPAEFEIESPDSYEGQLFERQVVVDHEKRRRELQEAARLAVEKIDGKLLQDTALEEENTFLTEKALPLLGRFDQRFLSLPREVLVVAMRNHQRYFSVEKADGSLANAFVAVANTPVENSAVVRRGFERVLVARLSDAEFFFETDKKTNPDDLVPRLAEMVFQASLGNYLEKSQRIGKLARAMSIELGLAHNYPGFDERVDQSCRLSKTDLLTKMVGEFPELQGVMGEVYALHAGYDGRVAQAVREHYLPRFHADAIPASDEGALVALADRLDTLAGCFGVGLKPTAAADPYGLRRQCLGVIAILQGKGYHLSLRWMLGQAVELTREKVHDARLLAARERESKKAARKKRKATKIDDIEPFEEELTREVHDFFRGRLRQRLVEDEGAKSDQVDAILAAGMDDILDARERLRSLRRFFEKPAFEDLAVAFKRVANIIKDFKSAEVKPELLPELLNEPEEKKLYQVYLAAAPGFEKSILARDFDGSLDLLARELRGPVDRFFDKVLVNDPDDPARQANRKALLSMIEKLFGRIADFTRLQLKASK